MESKEMIFRVGQELAKADQLGETVKKEERTGKSYQKVLKALLGLITKVNFRKKAQLKDDAYVSRKLHVVVAIDEIIATAIANDWGLCTKNDFIYVFNGKYWQTIDSADFKSFLADAVLQMGVPIFEAKYHKFKDELYSQFLSVANFPTPEPHDKVLVNLMNGTFEITPTEQMLREPLREDFLRYQLPFEYDPQAECPLFDKYLKRVLPDSDCQKVLAEYIGYIFINHLKLEKALILYGNGANGKSVFFEIVNAILGSENISCYSLENLTCNNSYQRAELSNKLLNYATEISVKLHTAVFKQLVSGEPVEARKIYGSPFTMRNYAKLMFNCNELPKDVEQTDAYFRRFLIVPFTESIPEEEQDPELARKIISAELSGIFNWALSGLKRLLKQGKFSKSELIEEQLAIFRKESDSAAMFLDEYGYRKSVEKSIELKKLFLDYKDYCRSNGYKACCKKVFSRRLRMLNYIIERKSEGMIVYLEK